MILPDLVAPGLRLIVCGMGAGATSGRLRQYYAGPGNKFWRMLRDVGLTPSEIRPAEYQALLDFGIGLTDLSKTTAGPDSIISRALLDHERLRKLVLQFQPTVLAFNGKAAAEAFLGRSVRYGEAPDRVGPTVVAVGPSTSGAANGYWDLEIWRGIAQMAGKGTVQT
jgi:double-stranded uracil-DNA glycosylase